MSYSKYSLFKTCPLYYYYSKTKPIDSMISADLEIGKYLHDVFYLHLKGEDINISPENIWYDIKSNYEILNKEDLRRNFESFEDLKKYYHSISNKMILWKSEEEYIEKLDRGLHNSRVMVRKLNLKRYDVEKWIYGKLEDFQIFGRFDIITPNEVIDIKSGNNDPSHREQLKFYSTVYYTNTGKVLNGKILYLQTGEIKEFYFEEEEILDMIDDITNVVNDIRTQRFTPIKGPHCRFCPYRLIPECSPQ